MFTGLVEHLAVIASITPATSFEGFTFTLNQAGPILTDAGIGDSICIEGACLTVTEFDKEQDGGWFKVGLAPETLNRTNLGQRKVGDQVNCERAMAAHTRFGGHFVQGHVDGTATIIDKKPDGNSIRYTFALPPGPASSPNALLPYLIEKGYVTVDGASLTLTAVSGPGSSPSGPHGGTFSIMLIAHSQTKLTLTRKEVGESINVEVDCVGKYVLGALGTDGNSVGGLQGVIEKEVERRMGEVEERIWKRLQEQQAKQ